MRKRQITTKPFAEELPRLLAERQLTLRALAREVGGLDHSYLSRMISGRTPVNVTHAERISIFLGLNRAFFPEVREARVIDAIRRDPKLRDALYSRLTGPATPAKR